MKLGLYSSIASPPRGENLDRCVDEVIAEAKLAEEAGFDSCFFGEHHQDKDGFLLSPLIVATAVAANTTISTRRKMRSVSRAASRRPAATPTKVGGTSSSPCQRVSLFTPATPTCNAIATR